MKRLLDFDPCSCSARPLGQRECAVTTAERPGLRGFVTFGPVAVTKRPRDDASDHG